MDKSIERILNLLPEKAGKFYRQNTGRNITEIRIRQGFDIKISVDGSYIPIKNTLTDIDYINNLYYLLCDKTVSAFEKQTSQGFITLDGGHRIGIAGKFSTDVQGNTVLTEITSMNIRLSNFHRIDIDESKLTFKKGMLIIGKPHSGKTNFIKNICMLYSSKNVVVCDERNELYSSFIDCDFIINQPKYIAIMQALRTLNPDYIVCDEIGTESETTALLNGLNSGVGFICTAHADSLESLERKPNIRPLLDNQIFDKVIVLDNYKNNFYIKEIYDL